MCTLSFIPKPESPDFMVTSNRDESPDRKTFPPKEYVENGVELLYPKDAVAGGTWIGSSSKKRLACLMNGGFKPHQRLKKYRMSRGIVVKKLLLVEKGTVFLKTFDLDQIEPFTLILIEWNENIHLLKMVWDGKEKHFKKLPIKPAIWSASMLYSEKTKREREGVFENFINEQAGTPTEKEVLAFHRQFAIDRGFVKTTSITQFVLEKGFSKMAYDSL